LITALVNTVNRYVVSHVGMAEHGDNEDCLAPPIQTYTMTLYRPAVM
jgi:hypothetical protein